MHILFSPQVSPPTTAAGYRARVFMGLLGLAVTDNCWGLHWGKWALPRTRLDKQTKKKKWTNPLTKQALMLDWRMKPCYLCRRCVAEKLLEEVLNVDFNTRFILFSQDVHEVASAELINYNGGRRTLWSEGFFFFYSGQIWQIEKWKQHHEWELKGLSTVISALLPLNKIQEMRGTC